MKLYRCNICGNLVELIEDGGGELVCCGEAMENLEINSEETTYEKHIPVVTKEGNTVKVKVGSVTHPMIDSHYINFIVFVENNKIVRQELKPGDEPVAEFESKTDSFEVYAYCNVHGFYKAK